MPVRFENQVATLQDEHASEKSTAGIPSDESSRTREPPLQRKKRVTIQYPDSAGESLKYRTANDTTDHTRPNGTPVNTPQDLVQEVRQKAADKDENKNNGNSKALQYKAGLRPTNPPKLAHGKSEYQRQFDWKKLPDRVSPIVTADNILFKSTADIAPIKVEGGPRYRSEYQRQYQTWDHSWQPTTKPVVQSQPSKPSRPTRSIDERSESSLDTTKSILDGDFYDKKGKTEDTKTPGYKDKISDYMQRLERSENPDRPFFPHRRRKKFVTEYQEHFKPPYIMAYRGGCYVPKERISDKTVSKIKEEDNSPVISPDGVPSWYKQILELREKVHAFRERSQQGTFFTRKNLLAMEMDQEELWERIDDGSSARQKSVFHEPGDYSTNSKKTPHAQQLPPSQPKDAWGDEGNDQEAEESSKADDDYDDEESLSESQGNENEMGHNNDQDKSVEKRNPITGKFFNPKSKNHPEQEQVNGFMVAKSNSDGLRKEPKGNLKNVNSFGKTKALTVSSNDTSEVAKENRSLDSDSNIRPPKSSNLRRKPMQNAASHSGGNVPTNVAFKESNTDRGYYSNSRRTLDDDKAHDNQISEISERISKLKSRLMDDRESVSSVASSCPSDVLERSKQRKEIFWGKK